jgi:S1-C subfamily serine protease
MEATARLALPLLLIGLLVPFVRAEDKPGYIGVQIKKGADGKTAIIQDVVADSPAAKAGLKVDDVIEKIDGKEFENLEAFVMKVRSFKPGDKIKLTIKRDGKEKEIEVTAGKAPEND